MTDPVTNTTDQPAPPSHEELQQGVVDGLATLMAIRWPGVDEATLRAGAEGMVALALEVGDSGAAVLIPDHRPDAWRLADAVRRTGGHSCAQCHVTPAEYDGQPTGADLRAADAVIRALMNGQDQ